MTVVSISQAKTQFSRLIARVEAGEEVTITRRGRPVARLVACKLRKKRRPGRLEGKVVIPDDFFDPLPEEELKLWEGE
jgi:prevent-host-death family protein